MLNLSYLWITHS